MSPKEKYSLKKTCFSLPLYCLDNLRSTNTKYLNTSIIKTWPQRSFISRHIIISEGIWFPMVLFLPKKENEHLSCFRTRDFMYLLCMHFNITINYLSHFHYKLQKQDIFLRTIFKNLYVTLSLASKQSLCVIDLVNQKWQTGNPRDDCGPQTRFHWTTFFFSFELIVNIYKLEDFV